MISIIVPGIRTHLWERFIKSVNLSCSRHDWEVIFIGPFDPPPHLNSIKFIKSYYTVPVSIQLGIEEAIGDLIFQTVDDCILLPRALDTTIPLFNEMCGYQDIMNMRYSEGPAFSGEFRTPENWMVKNCQEFNLPSINQEWSTSVQPLMNTKYLKAMGGLDCRFEYSNHSHHDLMFRCQRNGSKIYHSDIPISKADHMPEKTGDHAPIHDAQGNDTVEFNRIYSKPRQSIINFNDYKDYLNIWKRRFKNQYSSYEELVGGEGYKI